MQSVRTFFANLPQCISRGTAHYSHFFLFCRIFSRVITGVLCQNGQIESGDIYVLAAGIMVNPLGRTIGVNLPIYPLKGNVVTVPLKVNYNVISAMGSYVRVWGICHFIR